MDKETSNDHNAAGHTMNNEASEEKKDSSTDHSNSEHDGHNMG